MRQAIALGPFLFSISLMLVFGSLGLGYAAGHVLNRSRDEIVERTLVVALAVALVAARVAYIVEWFEVYARHPIDIIDVRDGGWNLPLGLLIALVYVMSVRRSRTTRRVVLRPAIVALAVAMVTFAAGTAAARLFGPPVGKDVTSPIALLQIDGTPVGMARFHGRPTVVNLWATWCGPCRRELPMLTQAQGANPDINFVFANQGEDIALVTTYLASAGLAPGNVVLDPKSDLARVSDAQGWPTTLYLGADGQMLASDTGELTAAKLSRRLAQLREGKTD